MTTMLDQVTVPQRKRWTREECRRLSELGFLPGRYELIDGEIIEKMTKNPPHCIAVMIVAVWLESLFGRYRVRNQDPVVLTRPGGNTMEPEPDLAVIREQNTAYNIDHPHAEDLLLVVEVSDTTLDYDLDVKAVIYAAAGIPDYWVLDLNARRLHVQRRPTTDRYLERRTYLEAEEVSPLARPETAIRVADLLPPTQNE